MTKSRYSFILFCLLMLFIAPGLCAYLFYTHPTWLGQATTNRGKLITPPVLLTSLDKAKHWRLIYWSPEACDQTCMRQLDQLARIRLALGRRLYHVDTCLILGENAPELSKSALNLLHNQDSHVLKWTEHEQLDANVLGQQPAIFITNPENYVILSYQLTNESDDIFQDIKQLVKD